MTNKNTLFYNNKNYTSIIIDTSSLLKRQFENFMESFILSLRDSGMKITIPYSVMHEIHKFCTENTPRGLAAKRTLENINALHRAGFVRFEGNPNSNEKADAYIVGRVIKARSRGEKILVITQDFNLGKDILKTNSMSSTWAPVNNVNRINEFGVLENFDLSRDVVINSKYNNLSHVLKRFGL